MYLYFNKISLSLSLICVAWGPRGLSAEDLQGMSDLGGLRGLEGRSAGAGSCALCREEAECPPQRESPVTTVWRSVVERLPLRRPLLFYSSITKKVGKQAVTEQHSTYRPV